MDGGGTPDPMYSDHLEDPSYGKQVMNVAKGIGMGVLAGTAVAAVSAKVLSGGRKKSGSMRKTAGKAMHTMSNLMGDMEKLLR